MLGHLGPRAKTSPGAHAKTSPGAHAKNRPSVLSMAKFLFLENQTAKIKTPRPAQTGGFEKVAEAFSRSFPGRHESWA